MSETDLELLRRYAGDHAEDAFAEIVRRHLNLVYSAALRQVRSPQLAEDVAQSTFMDLARNAARLKPDTILTAWLYEVTRRTAIDVVRREARRQLREQVASEMTAMNAPASDWAAIEPLLGGEWRISVGPPPPGFLGRPIGDPKEAAKAWSGIPPELLEREEVRSQISPEALQLILQLQAEKQQ